MDISLKTAAAIIASANTELNSIKFNTYSKVNVFSDSSIESIQTFRSEQNSRFVESLKKYFKISRAIETIRDALGNANYNLGVNKLLTERAAIESREKMLNGIQTQISSVRDDSERFNSYNVQRQLELALKRLEAADSYYSSSEVSAYVLNESDETYVANQLIGLRRRKGEINGELLSININSVITLDGTTEETLKEFNLI